MPRISQTTKDERKAAGRRKKWGPEHEGEDHQRAEPREKVRRIKKIRNYTGHLEGEAS